LQGEFEKIKTTLERINELYSGNLNELSAALNDISYGRTPNISRSYRGSFQNLQSAVSSVSRGYDRLADDLKRANERAAARPPAFNAAAARPQTPTAAPIRPTYTAPVANRPIAPVTHTTTPAASAIPNKPVAAPPLPTTTGGRVIIPSGAHEYNRKDFGKYK
jgi:hypothetical protein